MISTRTKTVLWSLLGSVLVARTAVRDRGVIYDHLEFGRRLFQGADLYAPYLDPKPLHPVYPPSFGLMTGPFALFPDAVARSLWAVVQMVALAWIGIFLARELARHWPNLATRAHGALAICAVLSARYVLRDTHGGGGNVINLALVLAAIHHARGDSAWRAGLALGVTLATKPTAILFVPLLWVFGFRRAALTSVGIAASLAGLSIVVHGGGLAPWRTWLDGTIAYGAMTDLFADPAGGLPPFSWMNQCLRCAITRYCGTVPPSFAEQVPGFFQGLGMTDTATTWIRSLATVTTLGATFGLAVRDRASPGRQLPLIAALFAASLLLSPISWKAHHVALIPAMFLLAIAMLERRLWAWILAVVYAGTCLLGEEIVGKQFKNVQQSLYFTTAGTIVLWILCLRRPALSPPDFGAGGR